MEGEVRAAGGSDAHGAGGLHEFLAGEDALFQFGRGEEAAHGVDGHADALQARVGFDGIAHDGAVGVWPGGDIDDQVGAPPGVDDRCFFAVGVHDLEDIGAELNRGTHVGGGVVGIAARVGVDEDMFAGLHLA